jgi:hypothetical protein
MARLLVLVVLLVFLGMLIWGLVGIIKPRAAGPARCRRCRYEVAAGVGAVGICPECGSDYQRVGILSPTVPVRYTKTSIAIALGMILILIAAVLYAPLTALWPWHENHLLGDSIYTPLRDGEPPARTLHITYDLKYVHSMPVHDGTVSVEVTGPEGQKSYAVLDAASLRVVNVDPGSSVAAGAVLTAADAQALYAAAGLDLNTYKQLVAEADAIPAALLADMSAPRSLGNRSGIGPGAPMSSLVRRGGDGFRGLGGEPVVPLWGARVPLKFLIGLVVVLTHPLLFAIALRAHRGVTGGAAT